jgi:hypothetical protein
MHGLMMIGTGSGTSAGKIFNNLCHHGTGGGAVHDLGGNGTCV